MNIQDMHNTFRVLGQQMGMQLNRGILPESIDSYINNVIVEVVQEELFTGVHTALQDSVNTQASTVSPVNAFRNLYRTMRYELNRDIQGSISNTNKISYYNEANGYHVINLPTINNNTVILNTNEYKINPMIYLGFSLEYDNTLRGNPVACRLVGADVLETTLRDVCNGAGKDSPIVVLSSIPDIVDNKESSDAISNEQLEIYLNSKGCQVKYINIKYLKVPNVVKYDIDITKCVNCDLPAYTHYGIVERAVQKFYASIGAGRQPQQQQGTQQ